MHISETKTLWSTYGALVLAALALGLPTSSLAGEYNQVLSIGDKIPAWKDLPGTDGKTHSLADLQDKDVVVVVFTCASCPFAVDYEPRTNELVTKFASDGSKVAIVAVCVNHVAEDRLPALTKRVASEGLKFHYLYDESQKIARDFGAIFTPEYYVFNKARELVYMGAMDDSTDPANVKVNYVHAAITAALEGKLPQVTETIGIGCRVRYARERRQRS